VTLSYISGGRVSWRDVLAFIVVKGEVTSDLVAKSLGIKSYDAVHRLARLKSWQMIRDDGKARNRVYTPTDYGVEVARNPTSKDPEKEEAPEVSGNLEGLYPDLAYPDSKPGYGPVALMRLVEVDYQKFVTEGLDALPSRVELSSDMIAVEKKYDGWLSQVAGGRLYSRRGIDITDNFLPISKELSHLRGDHLVAELVYWDNRAGKMVETNVTRIAGMDNMDEAARRLKELESTGFFQLVVFDVIAQRGRDISKFAFEDRRKTLESLIDSEDNRRERLTLSPIHDLSEWKRIFQTALMLGGEGVVLKNLKAPYFWRPLGEREPKLTGVQWKVKAKKSDDFVVFGFHKSEKGRLVLHFGQFCKGKLVEVGEVNNLSTETERETIGLLEKGPFVVELEYQERFPKYPGRLRNPAFVRTRPDKPIESATLPAQYC
jgi:ATP-dependent DNA ligase